jgi:hypothetical protein
MEIHRHLFHSESDETLHRVKSCLDMLENATVFRKGIDWDIEIVKGLTVQDLISSLVSAEQELMKNYF